VTIEWMNYGTRIDTVALLVDGLICLDLHVRLSEIDSANGITVDGQTIPGLQVLCDTQARMRLKHGQVLLLCGSISSRIVRESRSPEEGHDKTPADAKEVYEEVETLIAVRPKLAE
jgi:Flp pilus assembly secretin CpaC